MQKLPLANKRDGSSSTFCRIFRMSAVPLFASEIATAKFFGQEQIPSDVGCQPDRVTRAAAVDVGGVPLPTKVRRSKISEMRLLRRARC